MNIKKKFDPFIAVIIDDDDGILRLVSTFLKDTNWTAEYADNGTKGIELINKLNPDAVFLDLQLPGISGLEVLQKCHHKLPDTKFVIITGMEDREEILSQTNQYGAVTCLIKPFEKKYFLNTLEMIARMISLEKTPPREPELEMETPLKQFLNRSKNIILDPLVLFWCLLISVCIAASLILCFAPNLF
jgi:DNA-binding NtrC family response regulator